MPHILVTGGTGLVGSAIVRNLQARGHMVTVLSRRPVKGIPTMIADLAEPRIVRAIRLRGFGAVVHCAAALVMGRTEEERDLLHRLNVLSTQILCEEAAITGVKAFISIGTLNVLARPLPPVITEESPVSPSSEYSRSKHEAEGPVLALPAQVRGCVVRISTPLPHDFHRLPNHFVRRWIEQAARGETIRVAGDGGRTQDFVSVADIAEACGTAVDMPVPGGVYHIASGQPVGLLELAQHIAAHFGTGVECAGVDAAGQERWNVSVDKAHRTFGYTPAHAPLEIVDALIRSMKPQ